MDRVTTLAARLRRLTLKIVHVHHEATLPAVTTVALAAGGVAWTVGAGSLADLFWALGTVAAVVPAALWVFAALRRGDVRVDLVAVLALGGTLAVQEYLAGALIALMLATGRALESAAQRRASRDLRALLERAPRSARLRTATGVQVVPSAEVRVGDLLVVAPGEVVPVDGRVESASVALDESALTGEPLQTERSRGETVRSGVLNAGTAFELRATATERDSTYAGIVRLAQEAGAESAPVVRHDLQNVLDEVRDAADRVSDSPGPEALAAVEEAYKLLTERLLPHEDAEEHELYPALAPTLGGSEATATMSRAHTEIARLARRVATHLALARTAGGLAPDQLDDLRSCLYGLNTVLRLHFTQEEENYFSLASTPAEGGRPGS
ncbi:heavy metal translocating P-type ATPase [Streptomyces sp. NBC_00637]|uniref:heavy metal translocating P-type ATPase n=1 Tax=Streptomyces sp. NBC_00637 TaxID=2903667 RepID=UPI00324C5A04